MACDPCGADPRGADLFNGAGEEAESIWLLSVGFHELGQNAVPAADGDTCND